MANIDLSKASYSTSVITVTDSYSMKGGTKATTLTKTSNTADLVIGGSGQDYIEAGGGNDTISGANGKDTIFAGAGDDFIYGDTKTALDTFEDNAKDVLYGGDGKDRIYGGNGADELYGDGKNTGIGAAITAADNASDTDLQGFNDLLDGGNGPDLLVGGLGGDEMSGGNGPDVFLYDRIGDSRSLTIGGNEGTSSADWDANTGDWIKDFTKGSDKLDFTTLNLAHLELHFSATGPALFGIWSLISGGNTYVFADTNGDAKADMAIKVAGSINFTWDDFLGVNDGPTLQPVTPGAIAEIDQSSATTEGNLAGTLTGFDIDGDVLTYGISGGVVSTYSTFDVQVTGSFGTLYVTSATGAYLYVKNAAAVESLDENDPVASDVFAMTVTDGHGPVVAQKYTIHITGADDAPTLAAVTSGSIIEDNQLATTTDFNLTGTLAGADVDVETLTYGIDGGTTGGADVIGAVSYDVKQTVAYGTLYVQSSTGAYVFVKDTAAVEAMDNNGVAETASESFSVTVSDGDGAEVSQIFTINITGADDAPTLAAITAGSIAEVTQSSDTTDTNLTGSLAGADVDGDSLTYGIDAGVASLAAGFDVENAGTYGTLFVNSATGAYAYVKNTAAIEALDSSDPVASDVFTVTVSDSDDAVVTQTYTISVTGADDAPTLAAVTSGSITENDQQTTTVDLNLGGTLAGTDVDSETLTYGISGGAASSHITYDIEKAGDFGTLYVHSASGAYLFVKNAAAVEALNAGQNDSDVFNVTVTDGDLPLASQTFTVDINGAAEAPVAPTVAAPYLGLDGTYDHDSDVGTNAGGFFLVDGTAGADTIIPEGPGLYDSDASANNKDIINGFAGNDVINAGDATDRVYGGSGADTINGGENADALYGQADNDTIHGDELNDDIFGGSGNDILNGNSGNDVIYGGSGNDTIDGGIGNDILVGGYGADSLTGGDGADTFRFLSVLDTGDSILGWLTADDTLDFSAIAGISGALATNTESVIANSVTFHQDGLTGNTVIWADTDGLTATVELQVTLIGVTATTLNAADFVL